MSERIARIYPQDALSEGLSGDSENSDYLDVINNQDVHTLDEMFRERVRRSADKLAYSQYSTDQEKWLGISWAELALQVERWQVAFREQGLEKGDRVAICYKNSIEWVIFDQAALRLGLIVVPLNVAEGADGIAFMIADSGASLALFRDRNAWQQVANSNQYLSCLQTVLIVNSDTDTEARQKIEIQNDSLQAIEIGKWLPEKGQHLERGVTQANDLASIVYTSGASGRPKGVMLSHRNILSNAYSAVRSVAFSPNDCLLSVQPLSDTLERTVGYYAAMMCSANVCFSRGPELFNQDLIEVRPTVIISVPRLFESMQKQIHDGLNRQSGFQQLLFKRAIKTGWHRFQNQQGVLGWHPRLLLSKILDKLVAQPIRERLGGNLDFAIAGGAPLSIDVAKTFIALGIPLLQEYGLTESSPVVSINTKSRNRPGSVGLPLRGVEVRLSEDDEILVKGDLVMKGYWGRPEETTSALLKENEQEWLRTGDLGSIDGSGFIRVRGRIKEHPDISQQ